MTKPVTTTGSRSAEIAAREANASRGDGAVPSPGSTKSNGAAGVANEATKGPREAATGFTAGAKAPADAPTAATGFATGVAQTLRTTRQSAELPAAWLRGATAAAQTHSEADPRGYYDHRVAVHGAAATALLERFAAETGESKPELCAGNELLLVQVHGGDELNANLVAYDVLTGQARELGRLDYETLDAVLGWDGTAAPEALADGVRLPVENGAFDWGDTLVGFESIAEHQLAEPLDFAALVKLGESKQPALAPAAAGLSKAPPQVKDVFSFAVSGDAKSVTATSGATTFTLTASAGATFTGAGWSSDASITQSLAGLASPQLDREAWVEADDALLDSRFGTRDPRPLLWLEQSNGDVSVVAFGASAEQPSMLEIAARPLNVTLHE